MLRNGPTPERSLSSVGPAVLGRVTFAAVAVLLAAGCREILGDFDTHAPDASVEPADAGHDAHDMKGAKAPDAACVGATYPASPGEVNAGGDVTFTVSLQTIDWGDRMTATGPSFLTVGRNLDGLCSQPSGTACTEPAWGRNDQHADGPDGVDNAAGQAAAWFGVGAISGLDGDNEAAGRRAYIVRVSDYNGEPNDGSVTVAWFSATTFKAPDAGVELDADSSTPDGGRAWHPYDDFAPAGVEGGTPRFQTREAYVTNGTLVAPFLELDVGGPPVISTLRKAAVTATVARRQDGAYVLRDVILTGRWLVGDTLNLMLSALANAESLGCADKPEVQQDLAALTSFICNHVDVSSLGDNPGNTCDALSLGVKFDSIPAEIRDPTVSSHGASACSAVTAALCEQIPLAVSQMKDAAR